LVTINKNIIGIRPRIGERRLRNKRSAHNLGFVVKRVTCGVYKKIEMLNCSSEKEYKNIKEPSEFLKKIGKMALQINFAYVL